MNKLYRIDDIDRNLKSAGFRPLDILVVGGTGAGKSSTINALFEKDVVEVGRGYEPKTINIDSMELNEFIRFWDSPGLGDDVTKDKHYSSDLIDSLYMDYFKGDGRYGLIDMVLVILDGSGKDMGTTYRLLNEVVVPNFQKDRILVAVNQADVAMKGRHWNERKNCPDSVLLEFLEEKAASVRNRLEEATDVRVPIPVFYSAERGYNVEKLLDMIIDNMPSERRKLMI